VLQKRFRRRNEEETEAGGGGTELESSSLQLGRCTAPGTYSVESVRAWAKGEHGSVYLMVLGSLGATAKLTERCSDSVEAQGAEEACDEAKGEWSRPFWKPSLL
jgi:hypothetical protein